ncbi:hypothetical protein Tco_1338922 [Tanacetum coccineum]
METCDPIGTPMEIKDKLDLDKNGNLVNKISKHDWCPYVSHVKQTGHLYMLLVYVLGTRLSQPRSTSRRYSLCGMSRLLQEYFRWNSILRRKVGGLVFEKARMYGAVDGVNAKESWALLDDLALYDNESWNDPRDFAKLVKAISLPQDVPSTSDRRLIELKNQVQRLMEAHLAPKQPIQVNKITSSCEICGGPYDTQYCMENPEQAFVDYASSHTDEAGGKWYTFKPEQNNLGDTYNSSWKSHPNLRWRQPQNSQNNFSNPPNRFQPNVLIAIIDRITGALPGDTVKNPKLNVNSTSPVLSACSYPTEDPECSTYIHSSINVITIYPNQPNKSYDDKSDEEEEENANPKNINTTPPSPLDPSISFITEKVPKLNSFLESSSLVPRSSDTKFVCTKEDDRDVMFIEIIKKYDDSYEEELEVEVNAMTEGLGVEYFDTFPTRSELAYHKYLMSGPIPSLFLRDPIIVGGCPSNLKIPCNIGHVHVEKAYIYLNSPLNIITRMMYNRIRRRKFKPKDDPNRGDISSIINPRLSQVVIGNPFIEISNITHDLSLGVVKFTDEINEITYKMLDKIAQYNSPSDLEKEHTKLVFLRNEEDKRRGLEYVMNKILGFYKECLELGPVYLTGVANEEGVT